MSKWFGGKRSIESARIGLEPVLSRRWSSVLDLGCAEGALAIGLNAAVVDGVDFLPDRLADARAASDEHPRYRWVCGDLSQDRCRAAIDVALRLERYELVLALGVCHHMDDPRSFLAWAADKCWSEFVIRTPSRRFNGNDVIGWISREGFTLSAEGAGAPDPRGFSPWIGMFKRREGL